jgi:hypothetical protein
MNNLNTRRLYLPGGGSFDLPMPGSVGRFVEGPPLMLSSDPAWPSWAPILAGAFLGGAMTWVLLRFSR